VRRARKKESMNKLHNQQGFTLVEIVVAMVIFLVIIMVTANSFTTIANQTRLQSKSAETLQESIVGLEVLRSDLKQAGFGLPWTVAGISGSAYTEAQVANANYPAAGFWPASAPPAPATSWVNSFNDATSSAPRAVQSAETAFNADSGGHGSKYLVIKSMLVGRDPAAKKWTNVAFSGGAKSLRTWADASRDLTAGDRVIVVKNSLMSTPPSQQLMVNASGGYFTTFANYSTLTLPHQDGDTFEVYGVDSVDLIMPFNRADYYVMRPATGMPAECAPHTGVLYKAVLNHSDGSFTQMPLLDCVADLQVVYGLDTSGAGMVNSHTASDFTAGYSDKAQIIRNQLREIRVYLLAHEGKKDTSYSAPRYMTVGEDFGGGVQGRVFDLQTLIGGDWQYYRWKVHTMVVRPKNLF